MRPSVISEGFISSLPHRRVVFYERRAPKKHQRGRLHYLGISIILQIIRKPDPIIVYYSFRIIRSLITSQNMLTSIDVRSFRLYSPVSRQVQEIKGCFKQQMQPLELLSFVIADFRQQLGYISFAKGVKFPAILNISTKTMQPCSRACRFVSPFFWHLCCTIDVIFHI